MSCASSSLRRPSRGQAGTASLEFALVAVPFFLLIVAVTDLGRYFITRDSLRTLPLAISLFMSSYGTAWDQLMAIAVLGTLPMIILFFFLQRAFIQGIAVTGLKE